MAIPTGHILHERGKHGGERKKNVRWKLEALDTDVDFGNRIGD